MSAPFRTLLLLVGTVAGLACGSDDSLAPIPQAEEARVFTWLSLGPVSALLYPGETAGLTVLARDQHGRPMEPNVVTYSSSDTAVAAVSNSGTVTAVSAGTVTISATVTVEAVSRTAAVVISVEARVFTSLSLGPVGPLLYPGETVTLTLVARDQHARLMEPNVVTYSSSDTAVATVSNSGIVAPVSAGTATISATATVEAVSRTAAIVVGVRNGVDPYTSSGALLVFRMAGWEPPVVHVEAGAEIQWLSSGVNWAGYPTRQLWVLDENFDTVEQLDFSSGVVKRTFDAPGKYLYCARSCWDPPDFGVIHVH